MKCIKCGKPLETKNKKAEYCSECFVVYLDSEEFNKELNEILSIKKINGEESNNI